jgi:hypothetical protein
MNTLDKVAPLGLAALASRFDTKTSQSIERAFLDGTFAPALRERLAPCAKETLSYGSISFLYQIS